MLTLKRCLRAPIANTFLQTALRVLSFTSLIKNEKEGEEEGVEEEEKIRRERKDDKGRLTVLVEYRGNAARK